MEKTPCAVPHASDGKRYIINCAGERVPVADNGFTSRCAIGNTDDYLKSFKDHINLEIVSLGAPPSISVVIPSCASAEHDLSRVIASLCAQEYPIPVEIVVFINEPADAAESVRMTNERNESFTRSLESAVLSRHGGKAGLKCVRQVVSGGLAGVYQIVTASYVARVRAFSDSMMNGYSRPEKVAFIEKYLQNSMLLFCDDDMEIKDAGALVEGYAYALKNDAVILGRLDIGDVDTVEGYQIVLRDLMQLFFEFKYDHGLNFLTPRGTLLANILRVGGVKIGQPFADQVFFASLARGKGQYLLNARTTIGESDHPGNGNFLKKLRQYLQGEDNDALDIFENVLNRYQEDGHKGRYCAADIERLIRDLKTRDIPRISSVTAGLLAAV